MNKSDWDRSDFASHLQVRLLVCIVGRIFDTFRLFGYTDDVFIFLEYMMFSGVWLSFEWDLILQTIGFGMEIIAAAILIWWFFRALQAFLYHAWETMFHTHHTITLPIVRSKLGAYLLLSLEFIVAADIMATIGDPTMEKLYVLGWLVLIRITISYFLWRELSEIKEHASLAEFVQSHTMGKNLKTAKMVADEKSKQQTKEDLNTLIHELEEE